MIEPCDYTMYAADYAKGKQPTKGGALLPEIQKQAYEKFYETTAKNELLDQKTTVMIQLAASFVIGCYP